MERVKLESSNLVDLSLTSRMTKCPQKGRGQGLWRNFKILNPFRKFGTGEVRNFKFCVRINLGKSHLMDDKMSPKKGRGQGAEGSRSQIFKF